MAKQVQVSKEITLNGQVYSKGDIISVSDELSIELLESKVVELYTPSKEEKK